MANEIYHFGAVTIRVVGSGSLEMALTGFDAVESKTLVPFTLAVVNAKEPTRLTNFKVQRSVFTGSVTVIDSWFKINNITLWVKPVSTSFPG